MTRITLRLPDELHERLRATTRRTGMSLNQIIVAALSDSVARGESADFEGTALEQEVELIRAALGGLVLDLNASLLPTHRRQDDDLPDREELMRSLPTFNPPLSGTIIDEREDRF